MKLVWYFQLEGSGPAGKEIEEPFGFIVNCLICSPDKETALNMIIESLLKDRLKLADVLIFGEFGDFEWQDKELQSKLRKLAARASGTPQIPVFDSFHTWPQGEAETGRASH